MTPERQHGERQRLSGVSRDGEKTYRLNSDHDTLHTSEAAS